MKPNPAPAPVEDISKRSPGTIGLTFPPQKQFLTRLVVQAMPLKDVPKGTAPFSMFATTTAVGGKQVTVENAPSATSCMFHDLMPGSYYAFRLVSTNPHSTTQGIPSAPLLTMPQVPPKLRQSDVASSDCIEIVFPPQGQFLTNMKVHASLYKPGVNPWGEGTYGQFNVGHPTTCKSVVVNRLKPGTKYIFRLETENAAGGAIGETCEPILTLPGQPPAPVEETKLRTDTQLSLKWTALGQYITKLKLQCVPRIISAPGLVLALLVRMPSMQRGRWLGLYLLFLGGLFRVIRLFAPSLCKFVATVVDVTIHCCFDHSAVIQG